MAKTKENVEGGSKSKEELLQDALKQINKQYGQGSVLGGNEVPSYTNVISTGSLGLDIALEIGGLPLGKIVEIYGWESSGKSTLCQTIIGNAQKEGYQPIYLDGENSIEEKYATALGVNLKQLLVVTMDETAGEGAYDKMETLVKTGAVNVVVIDSYNSLQPKKIVDGEMDEASMGVHSRMMGKLLPKCSSLATRYNCLFIFVGQIREKIGVMFGTPETTQGGNALKFYSHIRLRVSRSLTADNSVMEGKQKMGNLTTVKIEKTKFGSPFKSASFNIIYGKGIDKYSEIMELAHEYEIIKMWGKDVTLLYNDNVKVSKFDFLQSLKSSEEYYNEMRTMILNKAKEAVEE